MSRTSRLRTERPLHETLIESDGQSVPGQGSLKSWQLPKTLENQTASETFEKHYSIHEISQLWGLSPKTVRRIFEDEPGVVELDNRGSRHKRKYVTRRVPESVLRRVHCKLQKTA